MAECQHEKLKIGSYFLIKLPRDNMKDIGRGVKANGSDSDLYMCMHIEYINIMSLSNGSNLMAFLKNYILLVVVQAYGVCHTMRLALE